MIKVKKQKGAAIVEYTIASLFMGIILFAPVPARLGGDNVRSTVQMVTDAVKENYAGYAWGMSVPL